MPLGEREGDTSNSRLCGVALPFTYEVPKVLGSYVKDRGFDFMVTPLMNPGYRPSQVDKDKSDDDLSPTEILELRLLPYAWSDYDICPSEWSERMVGEISSWIDLDSKDEALRKDSEAVLKQEIDWASYLSLKACLLPTPKGNCFVNYARCVSQILQGLKNNMQLWLRIPFGMSDDDSSSIFSDLAGSWKTWNSFRLLCDHHSKLSIALDILRVLPPENSQKRWYGEPVVAAILDSDIFSTKARSNIKFLAKRYQKLITNFFNHSIQIIISGKQVQPKPNLEDAIDPHSAAGSETNPLQPHLDHIGSLYERLDPLTERERSEFGIRDFLQPPSQPLKSYSQALHFENFEKDTVKYSQYQRAIRQALLDRVPNKETSVITTVLVVVGAGRGLLVQSSLQAAKETGRKLRVYAVEKNPNTAIALNEFIKSNDWVSIVTVVSSDVRYWDAPEKADILVSEMLGSFGDDELSPESLDGAQRFLKKDGISIPSSYTSFLQPLTASKLYNDAKARKDILNLEAACVTNIHNVARLAPSQRVFTFTHPKRLDKESNQRYKKLHFVIPNDTGSAMVHGFAGYFDATLYKDLHLGIEPSSATPNVLSWFPMFFTLRTPICVDAGSTLEVHFWRCVDSKKVWYEWCITSPSSSPIHNCNGRSHWMEL